MKKRTGIDYSQHEVITETHGEAVTMHHLKLPNTNMNSVRFINAYGILAVTGDFGNWIFCREFRPDKDGGVSDGYWIEKLFTASSQEPMEPDWDVIKAELNRLIDSGYKDYGFEEAQLDEMIEYAKDCLEALEENSERHYTSVAVDQLPDFADYDNIVFDNKPKVWLLAIFDAFDEICSRITPSTTSTPSTQE